MLPICLGVSRLCRLRKTSRRVGLLADAGLGTCILREDMNAAAPKLGVPKSKEEGQQ